jgi:hypothetical protein
MMQRSDLRRVHRSIDAMCRKLNDPRMYLLCLPGLLLYGCPFRYFSAICRGSYYYSYKTNIFPAY